MSSWGAGAQQLRSDDRWPLAIVADDLTGAADAAGPFAVAGQRVRVELIAGDGPVTRDVVAVSTRSRSTDPVRARVLVADAVGHLQRRGVRRFYKKIDSTLRGNLAVEIDAVLRAVGTDVLAVVCPAAPALGRTVHRGRVRVDDAAMEGREDRLAALLASLGSSTTITLDELRRGPGALAASLDDTRARVAIVDAASADDLIVLAQACFALTRPAVLIGSAGLAAALAGVGTSPPVAHVGTSPPASATRAAGSRAPRRGLVVVGSRQRRSREQLAYLAERPDVHLIELDAAALAGAGAAQHEVPRLAMTEAAVVAVVTAATSPDAAAPDAVAAGLAEVVVRLATRDPAALVLTGGDVAAAVLGRAAAEHLDVLAEAEPGLPLSRIGGGALDGAPIVTKAGGFGRLASLATAVDTLLATSEAP